MTEQPPWLAEAWRELGQQEFAGARNNPRITAFFKELGHVANARDEIPWCAAFVGACLERAGFESTRSLLSRSYTGYGDSLVGERVGALAILTRGANPALGHVGFLVGWSPERLWLLGGNQGDAVTVDGYARSRLIALRWPSEPSHPIGASKFQTFRTALTHVLEMEGGYSNDPYDPGGPTNQGITLSTLADWRGVEVDSSNRDALVSDLKNVSVEEVAAIYLERYWRPAGCAGMAPPLALFHFDAAVNHGVRGAIRMLQEAAGADVDGKIGPQTNGRITQMPILELIALYADLRRKRYRALPHFWRFGRGWLRRVDRTLEVARQLDTSGKTAVGKAGKTTNSNGERKMTSSEQSDSKWWGQSMTIWGAVITAAATLIPSLGPILGLDITAAMVREIGDEVLTVVQAVTALFGTLLTIYGRARAVLPLSRRSIMLKI
jgi:uncharacterized protein (TIGR02594 family)